MVFPAASIFMSSPFPGRRTIVRIIPPMEANAGPAASWVSFCMGYGPNTGRAGRTTVPTRTFRPNCYGIFPACFPAARFMPMSGKGTEPVRALGSVHILSFPRS